MNKLGASHGGRQLQQHGQGHAGEKEEVAFRRTSNGVAGTEGAVRVVKGEAGEQAGANSSIKSLAESAKKLGSY